MNARIQSRNRTPKLDFSKPHHQDEAQQEHFQTIAHSVGDTALQAWGKTDQFRMLVNNDAAFHAASRCATTTMIEGLFMKPDLETPWADGSIITITDSGAGIGDKHIEWMEAGVTDPTEHDGIVALDEPPERDVDIVTEVKTASFKKVAHEVTIGFHEIAQAMKSGNYDAMREKGRVCMRKHMETLNRLIRRGSPEHNLRGVTNYPGIIYKLSTVDWATAGAGAIYDEFNESIDEIYGQQTEEPEPEMLVLPRLPYRHLKTENFGAGTDTTLLKYILDNNEQLDIVVDPGMSSADAAGHPGALFLTPRPDLIRCTAPVFARPQSPVVCGDNQWKLKIEVWSYFAGVQVTNTESVLFLDGKNVGWGA